MRNFRVFPFRYWKHFYERLFPKLAKLSKEERRYFENLLLEIHDKFTPETFFIKNERGGEQSLNGLYIMGFHNQQAEIFSDLDEMKRGGAKWKQGN